MESKYKCLHPVAVPVVTNTNHAFFRCGKCPPCLHNLANQLAVRVYREFQSASMAFVTLTYDNEHIPIYHQRNIVDDSSGEVIDESAWIERDSSFFDDAPFQWRLKENGKRVKRFHPLYSYKTLENGHSQVDVTYFTTYMDDVQRLLKRFRKRWEEEKGRDIKYFKYCIVPEYGACGYRPHYHCIFVGLKKNYIYDIAADWQSKFGHADIDLLVDGNRYDSARKIGIYIGKYACKGEFDCPYVGKDCIKPRRCSSCEFGCGSDKIMDDLKATLLAYDVYKLNNPKDFDVQILSEKDIKFLASRRKYIINGYNYPLPQYLIRKIFYEKVKEIAEFDQYTPATGRFVPKGTILYRYRAGELQKKISSYILDQLIVDAQRECKQDERIYIYNWQTHSYEENKSISSEISENAARSSFISELERHSIF